MTRHGSGQGRLLRPSTSLITPPAAAGPSRRSLLRAGLLGAGASVLGTGALTGCGSTSSGAIQYWNLMSGGDGIIMAEMIDAVSEETGVDVEAVVLAWGSPYYTKLAMASAGGRPPDVAIMHMSRLPGYAPGGLLEPWDLDALAELGVSEDTITAALWEGGQFDGELYALALDTHPFVMFYNTDIVGQAGLLGPDGQIAPIEGEEAFFDAVSKMQQVTGEFGASFGYVNDGAQAWRLFWTLYTQTGSTFELVPGRAAEIDREAAVRAVAFGQRLLDGTLANPTDDYGSAIASFVAGRAGIYFCGGWEVATMTAAGIPFDMAPIPTVFEQPANQGDSHSFVLPRQSDLDPERRQLTNEFVAGMLKDALKWAVAGHVPAYIPVTETTEYAELEPQSHYVEAGERVQLDPDAWFTGAGSQFEARVSQSIQTCWLSGASPEDAVDSMVREINTMLETPNPA